MSAIKDKIDEVITQQGSDVTLRTNTINASRDAWGKPVIDSSSDTTIKAVKDNYRKYDFTLNQSGRMSGGGSVLVIKGDQSLDARTNQFIFDGKTYNILEIQPLEKSNEVLAQLLLLGED